MRRPVLGIMILGCSACFDFGGIGYAGADGAGASNPSGGGGTGGAIAQGGDPTNGCTAPFQCESAEGRSTPLLLVRDTRGCPNGTEIAFSGVLDPSADDAICADCDCAGPTGTCGGGFVKFENLVGFDCFFDPDTFFPSEFPNCNGAINEAAEQVLFSPFGAATGGGQCDPVGGDETIPMASIELVALCAAPPDALGCGDGQSCVPSPSLDGETVCVVFEGDVPCPAPGPYLVAHRLLDDVTDERHCSACECGPPANVSCNGGEVRVYESDDCMGPVFASATDDGTLQCMTPAAPGVVHSAQFTPTGAGTCTVSADAMPTGGLVEIGAPRTLCCLE